RRARLVLHQDTEREGLSLGPCLLDDAIDKRKVVLPFDRLKIRPGPAEIRDGLAGDLFWRRWVSEAKMEIGEPHARVVQDVVDLLRLYRYHRPQKRNVGARNRAGDASEARVDRNARFSRFYGPQKQTQDHGYGQSPSFSLHHALLLLPVFRSRHKTKMGRYVNSGPGAHREKVSTTV